MKRTLLGVVTILALGTAVIGSSYALFTDSDSIPGNTVATGTLELKLNHSAGKPFSIANAYPGYWSPWENMDLYNTGTLPLEAYMTFEQTGGDSALYDELFIQLESSGWDSVCHNGDNENVIYQGPLANFPDNKLVSRFYNHANEADGSGTPPDNIRPEWSMRICQRVGVAPSADNSVMGLSAEFTEIVNSTSDND